MSLVGMLAPKYRRIMKKFSEYILKHRVVIHNATDHLPVVVAFMIILLEEHESNMRQFNELFNQIEELRREIKGLTPTE